MSKVFERIMQKQINEYIEKLFSPYLCGFRKAFGTQGALTSLIESIEIILRSEWLYGLCTNGPLKNV